MKNERQPRSFWPIAITGYFVAAIIGIVVFIAWSVHQKVDLVRSDYYADEVQFQQQLDRVNRTQQHEAGAEIVYDQKAQAITLKLPQPTANEKTLGRVHLYRPSDAALDKNVTLSLNRDGIQQLDAREMKSGLWKVRLQWNAGGEEFYSEKSIVVGNNRS